MHTALLLSLAACVAAAPEKPWGADFLRMVVLTGGEVVIDRAGQPAEFILGDTALPKDPPFTIIRVDTVGSTVTDIRELVSLQPIQEINLSAKQLTTSNARTLRALQKLSAFVVVGVDDELIAIENGRPIHGLECARILHATVGQGVGSLLANAETLQELDFEGCRFVAGALTELRGAKSLRRLDISGATDNDLRGLPRCHRFGS